MDPKAEIPVTEERFELGLLALGGQGQRRSESATVWTRGQFDCEAGTRLIPVRIRSGRCLRSYGNQVIQTSATHCEALPPMLLALDGTKSCFRRNLALIDLQCAESLEAPEIRAPGVERHIPGLPSP